ncbi:hypothetical protein [Prosthecochloris sp. HL-130-GSB]|jgi:ferritin|nr:hypothetical protein [Prosthecochloris sp. HL-130-GSB]
MLSTTLLDKLNHPVGLEASASHTYIQMSAWMLPHVQGGRA